MGWVRCRIRFGARLALVALAVQIVLSFGHVHLRGLGGAAQAAPLHLAATQPSHHAPSQLPADDDDYCAICASIFLASTSFVSTPPVLPIPTGFVRVDHSFAIALASDAPRHFAFRSRAPPVA